MLFSGKALVQCQLLHKALPSPQLLVWSPWGDTLGDSAARVQPWGQICCVHPYMCHHGPSAGSGAWDSGPNHWETATCPQICQGWLPLMGIRETGWVEWGWGMKMIFFAHLFMSVPAWGWPTAQLCSLVQGVSLV